MNNLSKIENFINSKWKNKWLNFDFGNIFFRKSRRIVGPGKGDDKERYLKALDIATISIKPECQSKGIFTKLLAEIEQLASQYEFDIIYVENVMLNPNTRPEDRFQQFFIKKGILGMKCMPNAELLVSIRRSIMNLKTDRRKKKRLVNWYLKHCGYGKYVIDCRGHPCRITAVERYTNNPYSNGCFVESLIDSSKGSCSYLNCAPQPISYQMAQRLKSQQWKNKI